MKRQTENFRPSAVERSHTYLAVCLLSEDEEDGEDEEDDQDEKDGGGGLGWLGQKRSRESG